MIALSIRAGLIFISSGSISTKTGFAPTNAMELAVAKNVYGVVITSSPSLIPNAIRERISASVPLAHVIAWGTPT